jgi:C-terminal peptidase prc
MVIAAVIILPRAFSDRETIESRDNPALAGFFEEVAPYIDPEQPATRVMDFERLFAAVYARIVQSYVDEPDEAVLIDGAISAVMDLSPIPEGEPAERLAHAAIEGMLATLDPHSNLLTAEAFGEMKVQTEGQFAGLGIELTMDGGLVKVVSPIDHTPAQKAGVRAGDVITHVDNVSLRGLTLAEAVARMRGRFGTTVTITLRRQDGETLSLTLTRATIRIPPVRFRLEGGIGYVRITAFNEQTTEGLRHAIANLGKQLDGARLDLVLDLRRNPGGLLSQAVSVTDTFLAEGLIVSTLGRIEKLNQRFEAKPGDIGESTALVVLIDGGSASASEVVASALQYHGRAVVMGARSFGKGTVQTIIPLPQGMAVRLSTHRYHMPSGATFDGRGVQPDVTIVTEGQEHKTGWSEHVLDAVKCPPAGDKEDRVLGCAIALLRAGSLEAFLAAMRR